MNLSSLAPFLKNIISITVPISAGRILHVLITVLGMMMVARFGVAQLAAGTLAISSLVMVQTSTLTIFYAIGLHIRHLRGHPDADEHIGLLVKNAILLSFLIWIPAGLILSQMDKFLQLLGQNPHLVALTKDFFFYAAFGMFPSYVITIISQFYIGIGKTTFPLLVELFNLPLTLIFAYGFVLGNFGLPALGLGGISLAIAVSHFIVMIVIIASIYLRKFHEKYRFFKNPFSLNKTICRSLLQLGLPIGIQFGGELTAIAMASYLMGYMGIDALAAMQLTNQCSIIIMLTFGLSQALSLVISELHGQGSAHLRDYQQCITATLLIFFIYVLPAMAFFCTFSLPFAEWYLDNHHLDDYFAYLITAFFYFAAGFILIDGLKNLLSGVLRGLQDSKAPSRINLISLWGLSLPLAWFFGFIVEGGPIGLRAGFICGIVVALIWLIFYLVRKFETIAK